MIGSFLWKNKWPVAALVLGIWAFGATQSAFWFRQRMEAAEQETAEVQKLFSDRTKEVSLYRTRNGQLATRNEALVLQNKSVRELVANGNLSQLQQLSGLNRKMNNLEFVYQVMARAMDSLGVKLEDTTRVFVDTQGDSIFFKATDFEYRDKWAEFRVRQITPDSSRFYYRIDVPVTGVLFWEKKWFLGRRHYWAEATSENPHAGISELLNMKVGGRKKRR